MIERRSGQEQIPQEFHIDKYTPEDTAELGYTDTNLLDALSLLREGIWNLRRIDGERNTQDEQAHYVLKTEIPTHDQVQSRTHLEYWDGVKAMNRQPFLLVARNTKDGVVGVLEGREYEFAGTGEKAVFINWVNVRNNGSNDTDTYSYRGKDHIGKGLYEYVEAMAKEHGVQLLIAGVNEENTGSVRFHTKRGFINEKDEQSTIAYPTERGAFIPPYKPINENGEPEVDEKGKPISIVFYTKRLTYPSNQTG